MKFREAAMWSTQDALSMLFRKVALSCVTSKRDHKTVFKKWGMAARSFYRHANSAITVDQHRDLWYLIQLAGDADCERLIDKKTYETVSQAVMFTVYWFPKRLQSMSLSFSVENDGPVLSCREARFFCPVLSLKLGSGECRFYFAPSACYTAFAGEDIYKAVFYQQDRSSGEVRPVRTVSRYINPGILHEQSEVTFIRWMQQVLRDFQFVSRSDLKKYDYQRSL